MPRGRVARLVGILIVAVAALTAAVALARPAIPANAASTAFASDVSTGGECLDRLQRGSGWADICWSAWRMTNEEDESKDYYLVRVYGSHEGLRWLVVRAEYDGIPAYGVYDGWPWGSFDGACREVPTSFMLQATGIATDTVCGHTEATLSDNPVAQQVAWTCERCLFGDHVTRAIGLWATVGVKPGERPRWDLFADGGS